MTKQRKASQRAAYHASMREKPSSSTSGRSKGIVPTPLQKSTCKRNRSYKQPQYKEIMASIGKKLGKSTGKQ